MDNLKKEKEIRIDFARAILEHLQDIEVKEEHQELKTKLKNKLLTNFSWDKSAEVVKDLRELHSLSKELLEKDYQEFLLTILNIFNSISMALKSKIKNEDEAVKDNTCVIRNEISNLEEAINSGNFTDIESLKTMVLTATFKVHNQIDDIDSKEDSRIKNDDAMVELLQEELDKMKQAFNDLNEDLKEEIENAKRDPLTEIYNRKGYEEAIAKLEDSEEVCLVVCDIDHFKNLNDTYGHNAGDGALRCIAKLLQESVGGAGTVARYGGEEFVIIMPKTDIDKAYYNAEKIRAAVEKTSFYYKKNTVKITCSFGIAAKQDKRESLKDVFIRADKALYEAKKGGRNKVFTS